MWLLSLILTPKFCDFWSNGSSVGFLRLGKDKPVGSVSISGVAKKKKKNPKWQIHKEEVEMFKQHSCFYEIDIWRTATLFSHKMSVYATEKG